MLTPCPFCSYPFDQDGLGRYGCPNCLGEGLGEIKQENLMSYLGDPRLNNKPMLTAERKGFDAYLLEEPCPYQDRRKMDGRITWSRAYRNAWLMGFQKAEIYFKKT